MIPYETYKVLHILDVLLARAGPRRFLVPAVRPVASPSSGPSTSRSDDTYLRLSGTVEIPPPMTIGSICER